MRHYPNHDPLIAYRRCSVCSAAMSSAFSRMANLLGDPPGGDPIPKLRELAKAAQLEIEANLPAQGHYRFEDAAS